MLAVSAASAMNASAETFGLRLSVGGAELTSGAPITGTANGKEVLVFKTSAVTLKCEQNSLSGKLTANLNPTGLIEKTSFTATATNPNCETSLSGDTALILTENLPWRLVVESSAKAGFALVLVESDGHGAPAFIAHIKNLGTCLFSASNGVVHGFSPLNESTATIETHSPFVSTTGGICPKNGTLEGKFTLTSSSKNLELT
jgi:hypothetical protein